MVLWSFLQPPITKRSQMSFRETLSQFWFNVQHSLFPWLENNLGVLSEDHKRLVSALELIRIEDLVSSIRCYEGRPSKDRCQIARALIAKILFRIPTVTALLRTLNSDLQLKVICGWEAHAKIPDANAFSRAFKVFSKFSISEKAHQKLISEMYKDKIVMHLIKDSTPIIAREKAPKQTMSRKERKKLKDKEILKEKKYGKSRK